MFTTTTDSSKATEFDTAELAHDAAERVGADAEDIQRVTYGDGRTVWLVLVVVDGRFQYLTA